MSENNENRDQGISFVEAFGILIALGTLAWAALMVIKWMITTREGAITGAIAGTVIFIMWMFGAFSGSVASQPTQTSRPATYERPATSPYVSPGAYGVQQDRGVGTHIPPGASGGCITINGLTECHWSR